MFKHYLFSLLVVLAGIHPISAFVDGAAPFIPRRGKKATSPSSTTKMSNDDTTGPAFSLDPNETAIVLIEYQNEFTTEGGALYDAVKDCMAATNTLENSKALADAAREVGCTIIHVPISFDEVRDLEYHHLFYWRHLS